MSAAEANSRADSPLLHHNRPSSSLHLIWSADWQDVLKTPVEADVNQLYMPHTPKYWGLLTITCYSSTWSTCIFILKTGKKIKDDSMYQEQYYYGLFAVSCTSNLLITVCTSDSLILVSAYSDFVTKLDYMFLLGQHLLICKISQVLRIVLCICSMGKVWCTCDMKWSMYNGSMWYCRYISLGFRELYA